MLIGVLVMVFLLVSLAMIGVVLLQRPHSAGGGLSGAFGGSGHAGTGQSAFGAKTGDVLTIFTIAVFVLFLGTAIGLNFAIRKPETAAPVLGAGDEQTTTPPASGDPLPPAGDQGAQPPSETSDDPADPTAPAETPENLETPETADPSETTPGAPDGNAPPAGEGGN